MPDLCALPLTGQITKKEDAIMNYNNYETSIVDKYKIELIGWPSRVKFANPSQIGTVDEIRALRFALNSGTCKWHPQSKQSQIAHAAMLQAKHDAGETVGKKRKPRRDKGTRRSGGKRTRREAEESGEDEEEEEQPRRKKAKGKRKRQEAEESEEDEGEEELLQRKKAKRAPPKNKGARKQLPPAPKSKEFIDSSSGSSTE